MFTRILLACGAFCLALGMATVAQAQLTVIGQTPGGLSVYQDASDMRLWTVTLGQVRSSSWGKDAQAMIDDKAPGFRLPTFEQLQHVYNDSGGGPLLNIRARLLDYYETSDPKILANAFGNGFRKPQKRIGVGMNWVIGTSP